MIVPFLTVLAGAGLMYFLDPRSGKRRRALLRDQWVKLQTTTANQVTDGVDVLAENTANKARGVVAETAHHFKSEDVDDETLVARVRSEMGRYVSHPGAIEVAADAGVVTLSGNILTHELQPFVNAVKSMSGVMHVENYLQAHEEAGNIPDLQGGKTRPELR